MSNIKVLKDENPSKTETNLDNSIESEKNNLGPTSPTFSSCILTAIAKEKHQKGFSRAGPDQPDFDKEIFILEV